MNEWMDECKWMDVNEMMNRYEWQSLWVSEWIHKYEWINE